MDPLVARLRAAGCVFAEDEARLLRASAAGGRLEELVRRRVAGEPLEHLLGYVDFGGTRYRVAPGVFVPRQRSAALVEEAVRWARVREEPPLIVDLCCGAGVLGLAVRAACGGRLHAVDLDPTAVSCAIDNGVADAVVGDLFEPLPSTLRGRVDLLLANAPYVPTAAIASMPVEARAHEPRAALDGGEDGLDIQRRILAGAADWLAPEGRLLTETSTGQAPALLAAAEASGLCAVVLEDEALEATILRAGRH